MSSNIPKASIGQVNFYFEPLDTKIPCVDLSKKIASGHPLPIAVSRFDNFKNFLTSNRVLILASRKYRESVPFNMWNTNYYQESFVKVVTDERKNETIPTLRGVHAERCCKFLKKIEEIVPFVGGTDETEWFPRYRSGQVFSCEKAEDEYLMRMISETWIRRDEFEREALNLTQDLAIEAKDLTSAAKDLTIEVKNLTIEVKDLKIEIKDLPIEVKVLLMKAIDLTMKAKDLNMKAMTDKVVSIVSLTILFI